MYFVTLMNNTEKYSVVDGHLSCFTAGLNNTAVNNVDIRLKLCARILYKHMFLFLLGVYLGVKLLGCIGVTFVEWFSKVAISL